MRGIRPVTLIVCDTLTMDSSSVTERHSDLMDSIALDQRLHSQKLNSNSVVVTDAGEASELIATQYINLHRLPENLQKVQLVADSLSNDLLSQQVVELAASNDFITPVTTQYYDDEFLHHDLTEEDRRLAAALVAVQLVQQQKNSIMSSDMLKTNPLPQLTPIQNLSIGGDKQPITTTMVTSYLQAFEEEDGTVSHQLIDASQSPERILKIYQSQPAPAPMNPTTTATSLNDIRLPPLPPLKKVLYNPSSIQNCYIRTENERVPETMDEKNLIVKSSKEPKADSSNDTSGELLDNEGDSDLEGDSNMKSSKRSLPHKKRIPRKLKSQQSKSNVKYKCQKCGETFANQLALVAHRSTHQLPAKKSAFSCEICGFQNDNQIRFFEHLKGHYEPSANEITGIVLQQQQQEPLITYTNEETPEPHIEEPEPLTSKDTPVQAPVTTFPCTQCGKLFRRQKNLDVHMASAHPPIEEFSEPEDMMEGIRHVVNIQTSEDPAKEDIVKDWKLPDPLTTSMDPIDPIENIDNIDNIEQGIAMDVKPITIEPTSETLSDIDSKKSKPWKKIVQCPHCTKSFTHRNSLLYHIRSHSGKRPHQCEVCGKGFFAANALRVHMRMHSGDKPYRCAVCGRNFRQWGDLNYHMTSLHSDTKQYQCEFCGKDFARKYSLIVHRRIHTGEKNYVCEFCRKSFRASSYLVNHRRIHTGEKPYNCDVCHKPFRVKSDMKRHMNVHNKNRVEAVPTAQPPTETVAAPECIFPDNPDDENLLTDASLPLNLNMRQDSSDDLAYARDALGRDNTLYVWIPSTNESMLPD